MLTKKQKDMIKRGFAKGVPDTVIAKTLEEVNHMQVYNFRKALGISTQTVQENRYNTWMRLIQTGKSVEVIAELYAVKPRTIKMALWKNKDFSFVDARKAVEKSEKQAELKTQRSKEVFDW